MTKKKNLVKDLDPVKMMQNIREKLAKEIIGMTHEQEKEY